MSPDTVLTDPNFISHGLEVTFKWLFVIGAFLYTLFTLIVMRQISLMKKTLITAVSPTITMLGFLQFLLAIGVMGFYLIVL